MSISRRGLLAASASVGLMQAAPNRRNDLAGRIRTLFAPLPGRVTYKIVAPPIDNSAGFETEQDAATQMFVGSAFKSFVLCETLRQLDDRNVAQDLSQRQLPLDASVWSADSQTLNPPNLTGTVTLRTALEAMIMHSDNTATDIAIRFAQVERVRRFITDIGLTDTLVPDSTRIFFGYLLGAPDYLTFTWDELVDALDRDAPFVNPPLNNVESLASSADDLVSFYQRALQGEFFQFPETLAEFRRILTLADAIARVFPLGVTGFAKGGSIDVPGFHCISLPGAMAFDDRWVYFAITINWNSPALADPATVNAFANGVSETLKLLKVALSR